MRAWWLVVIVFGSSNAGDLGGLIGPVTLGSVGGGLHYTLNRFIDLRLENGWQLRRAPGEKSRSSRVKFSVVLGS
jgi:hypothetical protein